MAAEYPQLWDMTRIQFAGPSCFFAVPRDIVSAGGVSRTSSIKSVAAVCGFVLHMWLKPGIPALTDVNSLDLHVLLGTVEARRAVGSSESCHVMMSSRVPVESTNQRFAHVLGRSVRQPLVRLGSPLRPSCDDQPLLLSHVRVPTRRQRTTWPIRPPKTASPKNSPRTRPASPKTKKGSSPVNSPVSQ